MISDLDGSLGSRYFLNVTNEKTFFAFCTCVFKSSGLFTCLECTSDLKVTYVFVAFERGNGRCEKILPVSGAF